MTLFDSGNEDAFRVSFQLSRQFSSRIRATRASKKMKGATTQQNDPCRVQQAERCTVTEIKDGNEQITGDRRKSRKGEDDREISGQGVRGAGISRAHYGSAQERYRRRTGESNVRADVDCVSRQGESCCAAEEGGGLGRRNLSGA